LPSQFLSQLRNRAKVVGLVRIGRKYQLAGLSDLPRKRTLIDRPRYD
jgi:hypothetical protein